MKLSTRWLRPLALGSLAIAALVAILVYFSGGFTSKIEPGSAAPAFRHLKNEPTAEAHEVVEPVVESAVGAIQARQRTEVSSQVLAAVKEVRVRAGDVVAAGDTLVVLDDRDTQSRVAQAGETLAAAQADSTRAATDLTRYESLLKEGIVNQAEFDRVQSAARVAQAQVARAERALEEAEIGRSYTVVASPIDGRVVERLAEPGDLAVPGEPLLALYNPSALRLEAPVREALATRLTVGDLLDVHIETLGLKLVGEIEEIVPQAEAGSRSFLVKARLPLTPGLFTGMYGRLEIPAGERTRLCLPSAAIERVGQLDFVDVVGDGDRIARRLVTTGEHGEDGQIEVLSGLADGERVVLKK